MAAIGGVSTTAAAEEAVVVLLLSCDEPLAAVTAAAAAAAALALALLELLRDVSDETFHLNMLLLLFVLLIQSMGWSGWLSPLNWRGCGGGIKHSKNKQTTALQ